mmetsp:Transcript_6711/g.19651  ORF Transcript_6711/g.19651 Transcript_6711/m.19651 type:complete len:426 (+) Transcript_6711:168-1445(+)
MGVPVAIPEDGLVVLEDARSAAGQGVENEQAPALGAADDVPLARRLRGGPPAPDQGLHDLVAREGHHGPVAGVLDGLHVAGVVLPPVVPLELGDPPLAPLGIGASHQPEVPHLELLVLGVGYEVPAVLPRGDVGHALGVALEHPLRPAEPGAARGPAPLVPALDHGVVAAREEHLVVLAREAHRVHVVEVRRGSENQLLGLDVVQVRHAVAASGEEVLAVAAELQRPDAERGLRVAPPEIQGGVGVRARPRVLGPRVLAPLVLDRVDHRGDGGVRQDRLLGAQDRVRDRPVDVPGHDLLPQLPGLLVRPVRHLVQPYRLVLEPRHEDAPVVREVPAVRPRDPHVHQLRLALRQDLRQDPRPLQSRQLTLCLPRPDQAGDVPRRRARGLHQPPQVTQGLRKGHFQLAVVVDAQFPPLASPIRPVGR